MGADDRPSAVRRSNPGSQPTRKSRKSLSGGRNSSGGGGTGGGGGVGTRLRTRRLASEVACEWSEQGLRDAMEDAHAHYSYSGWSGYAVFDGHGGAQVSKVLSRVLLRRLLTALHLGAGSDSTDEEVTEVATAAFLALDKNLVPLLGAEIAADVGSTCIALVVPPQATRAWLINVGDSRAVAFSPATGALLAETRDQKPNVAAEKKRAVLAGGEVAFDKDGRVWRVNVKGEGPGYSLSRAFGDLALKTINGATDHLDGIMSVRPVVTSFALKSGRARVLLACDGLWDVMSSREAVEFVRRASAESTCKGLVVHAIDALGSTDNVSALLVDLDVVVA